MIQGATCCSRSRVTSCSAGGTKCSFASQLLGNLGKILKSLTIGVIILRNSAARSPKLSHSRIRAGHIRRLSSSWQIRFAGRSATIIKSGLPVPDPRPVDVRQSLFLPYISQRPNEPLFTILPSVKESIFAQIKVGKCPLNVSVPVGGGALQKSAKQCL